jgi:glycosyltransferase involved in cell wall biosynthesis
MITSLAIIALAFLGIRILVILINAGFYFRTFGKFHKGTQMISILVPARNEEVHLPRLLDDLLAQDFDNYEVWICDDHSTDRTPVVLEEYSKRHPHIRWFRADPLKEGWTGKNAACHQLAQRAGGPILLFLDADMRISGDILIRLSGYLEGKGLKLLSVFPKQLMESSGERASVPVMNWILLNLLPLPMVYYSARSSFAAANGQFMMFQALTYHKLQPHAVLRFSPVEDIGIMKLYKKEHYRCTTLLGDDRIRCRMYSGYREAIEGFSKNVLHFFSDSRLWLFFFVMFSTFGLLFIALWSIPVFLWSLGAALLGRMLISGISHQPVFRNLWMIPCQHWSFLHMVWTALKNKSKGTLQWKGRQIELI